MANGLTNQDFRRYRVAANKTWEMYEKRQSPFFERLALKNPKGFMFGVARLDGGELVYSEVVGTEMDIVSRRLLKEQIAMACTHVALGSNDAPEHDACSVVRGIRAYVAVAGFEGVENTIFAMLTLYHATDLDGDQLMELMDRADYRNR